MSCPINTEDIGKLKIFIEFVSSQPSLLNLPQLGFFKKFIEQLGGKIPEGGFQHNAGAKAEAKDDIESDAKMEEPKPEEDSEPESDIELDLMDTIIDGDTDPSQEMGEDGKIPTDDEIDQASEFRGKAAASYSNKEYEDAINFYTQAILLNPTHALFYAKRAQAFLKLCKPNAAIRDCNRALHLNPDNASAYKFRGRANRLLGNWESAAKDLRQACKLDYDDETDEWLKEVTPNAKKIELHKIKQERKKAEKEDKARRERVQKAKEANKKAAEENEKKQSNTSDDDFMSSLGPDVMDAFNDPEIAAALQDVMSNPANIMKYQNNPKVMNLLKKFAGATGGFPGGMPGMGGMGGFPNFPGAQTQTQTHPKSDSKPKEEYDDGLD
ncbi:hsc70-interacting protein 1-like [Chironomus tepperi]|uniref:hsc70-interacting protein 1-like n=1 Tax=Chironomus tepperi TaxID=113505 RepID=UPI00391F1BF6